MSATANFDHSVVAPPGVELLVGSIALSREMARTGGEMRDLGRDCARKAVHELTGNSDGELYYSQLGAPLWNGVEPKVHISISHTGQYAIGAASHSTIGVDIEFFNRDVSRIIGSFTPEEQKLSKFVNPIALLCAKESAGKAAGVGLAGSITRWSVTDFAADSESLLVLDVQTGAQWRVVISLIEVGDRSLQCAVAQPSDPVREELLEVYESAHVEMRPIGSRVWQEGTDVVRGRSLSGVVITAWNPGPDRPSREKNEQGNNRLLSRLKQCCSDIWEADGFSPDRTHREPGFIAWGMEPEMGLQIAREFGQFAIFYFEPNGNRVLLSV